MALALREHSTLIDGNAPPSRDQVLARYRRFREISKLYHHEVLNLTSGDALLRQARRLGLAQGRTLILDDMDEMNYVCDLAIHTAPAGALTGDRSLRQDGRRCEGVRRGPCPGGDAQGAVLNSAH
jgi:hypothetical protein